MNYTNIRTIFVYTNRGESMHKPTLRVMEVLELLCSSAVPLRLSDISRTLDVPKSTLLPILQTMTEKRYISKNEYDQYHPGAALMGLGNAAGKFFSPGEHIRRCLDALVTRFGETCYYGVPDGGDVLYLEKVDSPQPLRMLTAIGHRLPAYATGIGKALLMDHTKEQLQKLYPAALRPLTENTVTDTDALYRQLQEARSLGYTWEVEESTEHIRCFAVPIRTGGKITAAVSIAFPVFRYQQELKKDIIEALKRTAAEIEAGMQ